MSEEKMTTFEVIVEIPKGSRNKYEYDHERHIVKFDRMLYSSMHYPCDYGFFNDTLALDGDPLDVLVLTTEPTFPGCHIDIRPIGVFNMVDNGDPDEKIVGIPVTDPIANQIKSMDDLTPAFKNEVEHFFTVYKDLENKKVEIKGWESKEKADQLITDAYKRFKK